jgi:hypothetical protein
MCGKSPPTCHSVHLLPKHIWFDTVIGLDTLLRLEKWCCRYTVVTAEEVGIHGCDCLAGQDGNFCKHRAAVLLRKGLSPVEIRRRWGTLFGTDQATLLLAAQGQVR